MNNSFLHKGMIMSKVSSSIYKVWSPTLASAIPQGQWEQLYRNTGGVLDGSNLLDAEITSIPCRLCTSLSAGSWFRAVPDRGITVFTNKKNLEEEDFIDFNAFPDWQQRYGNGMGVLRYAASTPQASLAPCAPVLNQTDGVVQKVSEGTYHSNSPITATTHSQNGLRESGTKRNVEVSGNSQENGY